MWQADDFPRIPDFYVLVDLYTPIVELFPQPQMSQESEYACVNIISLLLQVFEVFEEVDRNLQAVKSNNPKGLSESSSEHNC